MVSQSVQRSVLDQLAVRADSMRRLLPAAVNWTLIAYAVVLCVGVWTLAIQHIQSDYHSTMEMERDHLRSVSATLQAQVEAMLGDGAVCGQLGSRHELEDRGRHRRGRRQRSSRTHLTHMLYRRRGQLFPITVFCNQCASALCGSDARAHGHSGSR